jgi:oxygen-dependent protoporphyrinogen oxidase
MASADQSSESRRVIVVGGGISGLACAYRLQKSGLDVMLLEAAPYAGGLVGTVERDGFLFETGPQSFQGTETLRALFRELGFESEVVNADPRAPRFIYRGKKLRKIPMSPQALAASSLLGAASRWRVASEPFRKTQPPTEEETIANFVRRKFGHEILEYLVAPFVSGVYAGDPEKLSLRAAFPTLDEWEREYGSVLRGAKKSREAKGTAKGPPPLCSFKRGMHTMMEALARTLGGRAQMNAAVEAITREGAAGRETYEVRFTQNGQAHSLRASAVVMATPAYIASTLLERISAPLAATLSGIAYAPVAVIANGYYARQFVGELAGFGVLIPRSEGIRTLGTVFNSALFLGRAPAGSATITSFVGGATDPGIVYEPEQEIGKIVTGENSALLQITGAPITQAVWRHPKALPQYNLGHGHIVESIRDAERELPGLFFAGNYLEGPALGKCVDEAFKTAEAAGKLLQGAT